jgi:voltage-gated potassium channel
MKMIVATLKACGRQLLVVMSGELVLLLISACILYYTEREAQPDAFGSIPRAMWWSVCTLTTVGYGDIYPVTALGKFLSGIISILGISAFALPTGIIAANFESIMERAGGITCPNCGEKLQ